MNLAQQIAARMLGAKKSVMGSVKSGAAGAPAAETGSKSERASGTQPRHLPTRALEPVPGFIRERNAEKRADPIQPPVPMAERRQRIAAGQARRSAPEPDRPVSTRLEPAELPAVQRCTGPRPITERPPPLPPVPPRAELEFDLVRGLQALPLPAAPASSAPSPATRGRGSCFAIDAETGRQCRLPAHPEDPDRHGNERGPFFRVLSAGQVPRLHQQLDAAAMASTEAREVFAGHGHASPGERQTRKDAGQRKSAHAGDSTSTGIKSIDTNPEASP